MRTPLNESAQPISGLVEVAPIAPKRFRLHPLRSSVVGALLALLVLELLFRLIGFERTQRGSVREIRHFTEGFATSHFGPDGVRLTGNPAIQGAPLWLIIGDSHVEAREVSDATTMGAVLEQMARSRGRSLNIRQYGWSGTAAPAYIVTADSMLRAWAPEWVIIVLGPEDVGTQPLETARLWRMRIEPDTSIRLLDVRFRPSAATGLRGWLRERSLTPSAMIGGLSRQSALFAQFTLRLPQVRGAYAAQGGEKTQEMGLIAHATVGALQDAYADRLLVVYASPIGHSGGETADPEESALLAACALEKVRCISTRESMREERDKRFRLSRGFSNTAPGEGHLNVVGHDVIARDIWHALVPPASADQ